MKNVGEYFQRFRNNYFSDSPYATFNKLSLLLSNLRLA